VKRIEDSWDNEEHEEKDQRSPLTSADFPSDVVPSDVTAVLA
jgi:hypothetical protein